MIFFILKKIFTYYLLSLSFKKIQPPSLCLAMISTDINKLHLFIKNNGEVYLAWWDKIWYVYFNKSPKRNIRTVIIRNYFSINTMIQQPSHYSHTCTILTLALRIDENSKTSSLGGITTGNRFDLIKRNHRSSLYDIIKRKNRSIFDIETSMVHKTK